MAASSGYKNEGTGGAWLLCVIPLLVWLPCGVFFVIRPPDAHNTGDAEIGILVIAGVTFLLVLLAGFGISRWRAEQ